MMNEQARPWERTGYLVVRRSFICHCMPRSAKPIAQWYAPLLDFDGNEVTDDMTDEGGPCGKEFQAAEYGSYGKSR